MTRATRLLVFLFCAAIVPALALAAENFAVAVSGTGTKLVTGLNSNTRYRLQCKGMDGGAATWFAVHYRAGSSVRPPDAGPHDTLVDFTQNHDSYPINLGNSEDRISLREVSGGAFFCDLSARTDDQAP